MLAAGGEEVAVGGLGRTGQVLQSRAELDPAALPCGGPESRVKVFPVSCSRLWSIGFGAFLLGTEVLPTRAPAAPQEQKPLRPADVEVLVARALAFFQAGAFQQANAESARAIPHDHSGQARYLYGVSCARLGDHRCAVSALEPLRTEFPPGTFPELQAELTRALLAANAPSSSTPQVPATSPPVAAPDRAGEAGFLSSQASEAPRSTDAIQLQTWIGLASGMELNIPGVPNQPWVSCGAATLGDTPLNRSCGVLATERLGLRLTHPLLRLEVEGLHRWYPEPSFHLMTLEGLRLELGTARWHGLEGGLSLEGQALADQFNPLYSRAFRLSLGYTHLRGEAGGARVAFRPSWEGYADLAELWALTLPEGSECTVSPSQTSLACTSGKSGLHSRLGGAAWWTRPRGILRLELWGDLIRADQVRYSGFGLDAAVKARALLHSDFSVQLDLAGNLQALDLWTAGLVSGRLALTWTPLAGILLTGSWNPSLALAAWHQTTDTLTETDLDMGTAEAPALYRRQSAMLELTWIWQKSLPLSP